MDLRLTGKSALVTAATGGIGLEIARALVAEGVCVSITGRTQARLGRAVADLETAGGSPVLGILGDAATASGCAAIISACPDVDILVNNLGICEVRPFEEISDADWSRMFETNVLSGARLSRHYFPRMLQRDWGRVVFISSESGVLIAPDMIHYAMSKTAQLAVSRGMAALTQGTHVTVNTVLAGPTRSDGTLGRLRNAAPVGADPFALEGEFILRDRPTSLIQRLIEPHEIASLVAFVASPLGAATNGAALRADGGVTPTIV